MNLEKVVFGFFIILAMTLNFGFVFGDIDNPEHHHVHELFAAIVVNLIATVLKFGERTQIGAIHLASSLVADLQLLTAAGVWGGRGVYHRRRHDRGGHRQRGVAVRRRARRQPAVGDPAAGGDHHLPALTIRASRHA
jgi:hypothetical protein